MADQPKIWIVDDEEGVISSFVEFLTAVGFHVTGYTDALKALDALDETPPDLILLDIMMPQLDGYEFCRRLRVNPTTENIPIVFVSGKDREDDAMLSTREGGSLFISKPVPFNELKEIVDLALQDRI
jgi:twitching motility two-component system response regulator PilH